ncbi:hypothetical protein P4123_10875 [Pseudomonas aeruginosa]|nr:hypothetical protein [Pseudomonas aeruginosa]
MIYTAKVVAEQSWADIPTCHEQGLGIDQYRFPRTVFLPGGVSDEQRLYVELMRKVSQTAEFRDYVDRSALAPTFLAGEDLVATSRRTASASSRCSRCLVASPATTSRLVDQRRTCPAYPMRRWSPPAGWRSTKLFTAAARRDRHVRQPGYRHRLGRQRPRGRLCPTSACC